ncbi:hypothetical protein pb186bvf_012365 [Paramecium bursaria]
MSSETKKFISKQFFFINFNYFSTINFSYLGYVIMNLKQVSKSRNYRYSITTYDR